MALDSKIPGGPIADKWDRHKFESKLVSPANRRKFTVIVVGTGLAGGAASAALGELGYNVKTFCIHDSPRRAHSIAAQGGINAAKNYRNDGDSVERLFYDTVKGGDYRAREANVYRLAQVSVDIIDQCVAQGVPFAREYGGLLDNRSFGGAQVSRTFYARGQTGQQLLIGAYQSMMRQVEAGTVALFPQREMLDLVVIDGKARGIITRNLVTGEIEKHWGDAVCLATGGYGTAYYLSTNAVNSNVTAAWRCHKRGAYFANPCFTQIHPTCIPVSGDHQSKLTLMSESLRNDGRVWVPRSTPTRASPTRFPRTSATTTSSAATRVSATSSPATSRRVPPRPSATRGGASARPAWPSTSTSLIPSSGWAKTRFGRATATSSTCTRRSPTRTRTSCRCASSRPCTTRWAGSGSTTT
jgi:succinate dehydrogenase / fumarate reductase flavoprotein subunit